jgi:hypothetical protein
MRQAFLLSTLACVALAAQAPKPSAEIKVGTAVEKMELQGEATTFKVAAGTKLFAWVKVAGAADSAITVAFSKGDRITKQELKVPRSPYRTNAYRTFRKGDEGAWTVKVLGADGAELGAAAFTVEME